MKQKQFQRCEFDEFESGEMREQTEKPQRVYEYATRLRSFPPSLNLKPKATKTFIEMKIECNNRNAKMLFRGRRTSMGSDQNVKRLYFFKLQIRFRL